VPHRDRRDGVFEGRDHLRDEPLHAFLLRVHMMIFELEALPSPVGAPRGSRGVVDSRLLVGDEPGEEDEDAGGDDDRGNEEELDESASKLTSSGTSGTSGVHCFFVAHEAPS
jgi:hypothetical protein